jgi:hypothetical protein
MRLTPYQIIAPLVSLTAIVYAWNLVLRQKKTIWEASLWMLFWGAIAVFALFPWVVSYLSIVTGIANQESAVLVTFMGILFFIVFYVIVRLEELEQKHTRLVREVALREAGLEKEPKHAKRHS